MKLFSSFFNKAPKELLGKLEQLLMEAVSDPQKQMFLYKEFLATDLYVLGNIEGTAIKSEHSVISGEDTKLNLRFFSNHGETTLPVFSSLNALRTFIQSDSGYIQLNGRVLIENLREDVIVFLNPKSQYSKRFEPEEISAMLNGTVFNKNGMHTISAAEKVLLGEPANYPELLDKALKNVFASSNIVDAAYITQIFHPSSGNPPNLVIGIQFVVSSSETESKSAFFESLQSQVKSFLSNGEFIDFLEIGSDQVSEYMLRRTNPFYKK